MRSNYEFKCALKLRFLGVFFIITFVPMLLMSIFYYWISYNNSKTMLGKELLHIAKGAAVMLDCSILKQAEMDGTNDSDSYKALHRILSNYKQKVNARFVYTLVKGENKTRIIIDAEKIGDINYCNNGQVYELNKYMEEAFNGKGTITKEPYSDRWGMFLTGYAPIIDPDTGQVNSIVGVDIDASRLDKIQDTLALSIAAIFLICIAISLILANYFTRQEILQINKMLQVLQRAGEGDFSPYEADKNDRLEMHMFTQCYNQMIGQIKGLIDKVEEANHLKSEFISIMSHELRTPLNSIIGYTDLVLKQTKNVLTPKQEKHLQTVKRNGHHLLKLINEILDISAIEAGKKELILEHFDCIEIIDEVIDLVLPLARKKNLNLINATPEKEISIYSDRQKLLQILINLAGNAIKFTEQGEIKMVAQSVLMNDGTYRINFCVCDTGIGIEEKSIETIFEAFRQVDGSVSREKGGTGLGLYLTKKICDLLKGTISVNSKVNQGTTFSCSFPKDW